MWCTMCPVTGEKTYVQLLRMRDPREYRVGCKGAITTHTCHSTGAPLTRPMPVTSSPTDTLFSLERRLSAARWNTGGMPCGGEP